MEGLSGFSDDMVMSLDEFRALGRNHMVGREALWQEMIDSRSAGDLAIWSIPQARPARPRARCTPTAA